MEKTCERCVFWTAPSGPSPWHQPGMPPVGGGQCRRNAPIAGMPPPGTHWPLTAPTDFCGEFSPREASS
jgi:hypothetical protein